MKPLVLQRVVGMYFIYHLCETVDIVICRRYVAYTIYMLVRSRRSCNMSSVCDIYIPFTCLCETVSLAMCHRYVAYIAFTCLCETVGLAMCRRYVVYIPFTCLCGAVGIRMITVGIRMEARPPFRWPSLSQYLLLKTSEHIRIFHRMSRRVIQQ